MTVRFTLNGSAVAVDADPRARLLYVLRNDLDARGTRFGCGAEACGACVVMIDGSAQPSCTLPVSAVEGRSVTTVEGLGTPAAPHRLQQAFIELQAVQCGYCASGVLVRAAALLAHDPKPDRDTVVTALDGHLCRCGMQQRMVDAVLRAAG